MQQKFVDTIVFQPFQHQDPLSLVDLTFSIFVKTFVTVDQVSISWISVRFALI